MSTSRLWHSPASDLRKAVGGFCAIALLVLASYLPALRGGYVWDDDSYLTANPTLTQPGGLRRIWLEPRATPQYYPLVFTSFWVEHRLWQFHPAGYHGVNAALHSVNANLLWLLLSRVGFPLPWAAAAIFALHPLQVESVAWISERKNLLSGFFYLLSAVVYLPLLAAGAPAGPGVRLRGRSPLPAWLAAFSLFLLALLAKSVTATLPAALLLLAWWQRGRVTRRDVGLLAPFFAVGAASGLLTAWLERNHVGAGGPEWSFSFSERLVIAGKNFWFYLAKTFWPHPLSFTYPRWQPHGYPWWHLAAPGAAIALLLLLWRYRSRIGRGPLAAALYLSVTLAPALGFVDFYPMRYSFVADHFFYLALIGPVLCALGIAATGMRLLQTRGTAPGRWPGSRAAAVALGGLLLLLAALTWQRSGVFRDEENLWRDTLAKNPAATSARVNLGVLLAKRGDYPEAFELFQRALAEEPESADILANLGNVLAGLGRPGDAESSYRAALRSDPGFVSAHLELGKLLAEEGFLPEAEAHLRRALELDPANAAAREHLGLVLEAYDAGDRRAP